MAPPRDVPSAPTPASIPDARPAADVAAVRAWFREHGRDLPWRGEVSPWAVLVSEVMLQQTPVVRVEPRWRDWLERWPTAADLAAAPRAEVLAAWDSLGYPRRALRLQECAREIVSRHGGRVPGTEEDLLALPGIGPYTAAAVVAFAFGRRSVVLDTNVRRVISRWADGRALPPAHLGSAERERAARLVPADDAGAAEWAAASMELGALVCTARSPRCSDCPLRERCAWALAGFPADAHAATRRRQPFEGTDRQRRGRIMRRLREAHASGERWVAQEELHRAAKTPRGPSRAGACAGKAPPGSPGPRILAGLVADGLVSTDGAGRARLAEG